ncbi:MAG: response regulator transcription factor [Alphaproteobacteria bacterium]|nr:response regulator transcription factor [Alphaproteobacteria bacterium]MCB9698025.1 response regulator transcription factor [Alphaproteobacteria bacterium]
MPVRVLMIDDDPQLAELLAAYLRPHDVLLTNAPDGARGLKALEGGGFDAVVLDVMMPGLDGLDVLRRLRATSALPVLMLTARGDETDRVVGLELGADDYLAKPVYPRELLARIRAVLRRTAPREPEQRLVVGDLEIDPAARVARVGADTLSLTALEFDLLLALAERAGRVVPRDALWEAAGRGETHVSDRTVDVHVSHLRAKLGDDARDPRRLKTVRGAGYVLVKEPG